MIEIVENSVFAGNPLSLFRLCEPLVAWQSILQVFASEAK
jgi:hypothetical protein